MQRKQQDKIVPLFSPKTFKPTNFNLANGLSLLRMIVAPIIVWLLLTQRYATALALFVLAGLSDLFDGIVARWMKTKTTLGAYLDPLADKVLVSCVYVTLGAKNFIPLWLMILVIFRDFLILGGIIVAALFSAKPLKMEPIRISKVNTALQLLLVLLVLVDLSVIHINMKPITWALSRLIATTTILSGTFYVRNWLRHMNG